MQNIQDTLPPMVSGRDRPVIFEPSGAIVYENNGDPPLEINGYQRDLENPFRFTSLWPECSLRHGVGVRYVKCGCINVIMRCNNPASPNFADRVKHTECQQCQQ